VTLDVGIRVEGLDEAVRLLARVPSALDSKMGRAMREILGLYAGDLAEYPSAIPGTRYRRTGLLGQRWAAATRQVWQRGPNRLQARMRNTRPGVVYVQSDEHQADVHRGRWRTAERVVESRRGEVENLVRAAGQAAVEGR